MRRKENLLSIAGRVRAMALSGRRRFAALTILGTKLFFLQSAASLQVMSWECPSPTRICLQAGLSPEYTCAFHKVPTRITL